MAGAAAPAPDSLRAARACFGAAAGQGLEAVRKPAAVRDGRAAAGALLCGVHATKACVGHLTVGCCSRRKFRFSCCWTGDRHFMLEWSSNNVKTL